MGSSGLRSYIFFSCFPESNEKSFVRLGKSIAEAYQQRDCPHLCNNFELCSAHFCHKFMYCRWVLFCPILPGVLPKGQKTGQKPTDFELIGFSMDLLPLMPWSIDFYSIRAQTRLPQATSSIITYTSCIKNSKCGCPQGHVGSNPTFSANKACNCNGCRLLNFLEIAVFARFSVGRTAEYLGRTFAIFEKYRLYRIENLNYIQQFFHLLSKQLSSGNSSIFVIASTEEIFDE